MSTLEDQVVLSDAAGLVSYLQLRPGGSADNPIIAHDYSLTRLLAALERALELSWPDRPGQVSDLEQFLPEAYRRFVATSDALATDGAYVEAARWSAEGRNQLLEHVKLEIEALVGGVKVEDLWQSFETTGDTAPLKVLIENGLLVTYRSHASFLVGPPNRFEDEICAADFFPIGEWEEKRNPVLVQQLVAGSKYVNKQVAHLTVSRPLANVISIYRPGSYADLTREVVELMDQFTELVDPLLLPDWWHDWLDSQIEELGLGPDGPYGSRKR